ncbi:albusnodin/ikarugamycin family macrolactam cyclase [Kitasatospora sp. NPDC101176]|uniref:albusnodin/ikarugamycin family macrolactam cyclase n=1 Tax=Kitasatospora sp. NPDC101176 TaxID=3364099 RepID=UPI00380E68D4
MAALTSADVDAQRLACAVFLPSVPALAGARTFFTGVEQLLPGARIELPADGSPLRTTPRWRPDQTTEGPPHQRLRAALTAAVSLRADTDPGLSCDLSGGLDSTSVTVLAATTLPPGHAVNAVTVHPVGDESGADLRYARLAAAAHSAGITHHLMPLTAEHLPYSAITDVPATDEPAPSTLTRARLTGQFRWMTATFGTTTHLTGDGGDSVLFQPPIHLADLVRSRRPCRLLSEALGWARLRHRPAAPILRDAQAAARTSRRQALTDLAHTVGTVGGRNDHGAVRWFSLLPFPAWADPSGRHLLAAAATTAALTPDAHAHVDASVRTLVDEIREVARTAAADSVMAAAQGITLHNPFLDPTVVDAVLRTPLDDRPPVHAYKPMLGRALADVLPPAIAARTTKGSFDADHYAGMRANLPTLLDLADGHLASLGLLDPTRFRTALRRAAAGIPGPLATIEQALAAEAWLTAHRRDPVPAWEQQGVGTA